MRSFSALPLLTIAFATACTLESNEAPAGDDVDTQASELRRSDFGQSRSLSVRDQTGTWRGDMLPRFHGTGTLSTALDPLRSAGVTSIQSLSWVGDANSYIDVFDQDFRSVTAWPPGTGGPQFVRVRYPWPSNASWSLFWPTGGSGTTIPRALQVDLPGGRQWKAFRHYDRGECSAETSWSTFLDGIKTSLGSKLGTEFAARGLGRVTLRGAMTGNLQIVPTDFGDVYRIRATYDVERCSAQMDVGFGLRIGTSERAPRVTVDGTPTVRFDFGDDACAGLVALSQGYGFNAGALQTFIEGEVRSSLARELGPAVEGAFVENLSQPLGETEVPCIGRDPESTCLEIIRAGLRSGVGGRAPNLPAAAALSARNARCVQSAGRSVCRFVPNVQRIHNRPDGLELVFTDLRSDPHYSLLESGGVCARPEPAATATPAPVVMQSFATTRVF
jgi:hypothetical protein